MAILPGERDGTGVELSPAKIQATLIVYAHKIESKGLKAMSPPDGPNGVGKLGIKGVSSHKGFPGKGGHFLPGRIKGTQKNAST